MFQGRKIEELEEKIRKIDARTYYHQYVRYARDCHGTNLIPTNELVKKILDHLGLIVEYTEPHMTSETIELKKESEEDNVG